MVEWLALPGAFATIVGLLSNFKAERSGADLAAFMEWLRAHEQEEVARAIQRDRRLAEVLGAVLARNHEELDQQLKSINEQLSLIAREFSDLALLSSAFGSPLISVSEHALAALRQLVESGARHAQEHRLGAGGKEFLLISSRTPGSLEFRERQHMEEDIAALERAALIRIEYTSGGARKISATRAGVAKIKGDDTTA